MIKNIIFDLGNVIIDLNEAEAKKALIKIAGKDFEEAYAISENKPNFFNDFEKGWIYPDEFRNLFRSFLKVNLDDKKLDEIWNTILGDFQMERIILLEELLQQKKYRTFLLSNTNDIHIPEVENILRKNTNNQYTSLQQLFEKVYYSQNMGLRKPDIAIYEQVLNENNLLANETIFFDDNVPNIKASKSMGIHSKLIIPNEKEIMYFFKKNENGIWELNNID